MWKQLTALDLGRASWPRHDLRRCDPYLVWAEATTLPVPDAVPEPLDIAVLVELLNASEFDAFVARINTPPPFCFLPSGQEHQDTRFVTAFVSYLGLERLVAEVRNRTINRFTLQESRTAFSERAAAELWTRAPPLTGAVSVQATASHAYQGSFLGIIDDGLPFARVQALGFSKAEGASLWDQGWEARNDADELAGKPGANLPQDGDRYWNTPWEAEWINDPQGGIGGVWRWRGFFHGRRLKPLPHIGTLPVPIGGDTYFRSRYFSPAPRQTHGAAVLGLMAPWLAAAEAPVEWPDHISGLAMVQLPTRTVNDTAGGSLGMRVLDGLRFILWQEARTRPAPQQLRPLVVNLSYGVHGGPHDGTSMLESAFAEALTAHPNMHLVLAAGNAHRAGCHARHSLTEQGGAHAIAEFMLRVLPDNKGDTFVEFWLPSTADVVLGIRPPGSANVFEIRRGEAWLGADLDDAAKTPRTVHFGAIYADQVAQGEQRTMMLLAIGSTRHVGTGDSSEQFTPRGLNQRRRRNVLGPAGMWTVTVKNVGGDCVTVDAWVERGDAPPDSPSGSRQAYFPDSCVAQFNQGNATPEGTLNGIATFKHSNAHVVGAMRTDARLSDYSSAGPRAVASSSPVPTVVVPADWSLNLPGVKTMGFAYSAITRINGTSAASAVYTRALAEKLGRANALTPKPMPKEPPPERDCSPERQPSALPELRGQQQRENWPFEVFRADKRPPR